MKIELNLNEADAKRLKLKAAEGGITVSELLTYFASDLIHGAKTRGSDERMYARAWYDRCGFSYFEESFLSHLAYDGVVDHYMDIYQAWKETGDETLAEEIQEAYQMYGCTGDWKQEMAEAEKKWR